jgi:uncharacterized membrane protein
MFAMTTSNKLPSLLSYQQDYCEIQDTAAMESTTLDIGLVQRDSDDESGHYIRQDSETSLNDAHVPNSDSHVRSLAKGISYRLISSLATIGISFLVLGDVSTALQIGFVDFFAKIIIYYLHERAWSKITFV